MKLLTTCLGAYPVDRPTVEDVFEVASEMRLQAKKKLVTPLEYVASMAGKIAPQFLELAMKQAVALGSGGGSEPSVQAQNDQYVTEDGLAWRVWYHVSKRDPSFTLVMAQQIVEKDGRWKTATALEEAITYPEEAKKNDPQATGTSSS